MTTRLLSLGMCLTLLAGCVGYNGSAKKWAYFGDVILLAGGGAALAVDQTNKPAACEGSSCPYQSPVRGGTVAGALLIGAGLLGVLFTATRDTVKTSR
ncbi:hypothetical protein BH11MYX1_BH11MYX1_12370 [soil metagenome]